MLAACAGAAVVATAPVLADVPVVVPDWVPAGKADAYIACVRKFGAGTYEDPVVADMLRKFYALSPESQVVVFAEMQRINARHKREGRI